jgi:hypothetical protein
VNSNGFQSIPINSNHFLKNMRPLDFRYTIDDLRTAIAGDPAPSGLRYEQGGKMQKQQGRQARRCATLPRSQTGSKSCQPASIGSRARSNKFPGAMEPEPQVAGESGVAFRSAGSATAVQNTMVAFAALGRSRRTNVLPQTEFPMNYERFQ